MRSSPAVFLRAAVMLGVLVVLPAYALLDTSLPDKLLPLVDHLAERIETPAVDEPLRPSAPGVLAPHAPAWHGDAGVALTPGDEDTPIRPAELLDGRSPNRLVSWEEAVPGADAGQRLPPDAATVRVSEEGRRVLPPDGFSQRAQALWEVGATRITVSVEYTGRTPSYWCSCQVVDRRERFEAVAANALGAMDKVLEQIHAWQSATRRPVGRRITPRHRTP